MAYLIATGHDIALESLVAIVPQPRTVGYQYGRRQYAANGSIIDEAPFVSLQWDMIATDTEYQSLLSQFGLTSATTANVSVYIQDERYNWIVRNAVAVLPFVGTDVARDNYFIRNVTILLKNIRVQS